MSEKEKSAFLSEILAVNVPSSTRDSRKDTVTRGSMRTLLPEEWLNDEIIGFYLKVNLQNRDNKLWDQQKKGRRSHFFNSYFWQTLFDERNIVQELRGQYNYEKVRKWSKKVSGGNIFELKRLFIPINYRRNHWALGVIHIQNKLIQYYDSTKASSKYRERADTACNGMLNYLKDEHKTMYGREMNTSDWTIDPHPKDVPQQRNGKY